MMHHYSLWRALSTLLLLTFFTPLLLAQETRELFQGFENDGSGDWNFTLSPAAYNADGGNDVWADTSVTSAILPATGQRFWYMADLENPNGGNDSFHTMDFEEVDLSGFLANAVSFKYYTIGYEDADSIGYIIETEPGSGFDMDNYVDLERNTQGWITVFINLPVGAPVGRLRLMAKQNGGSDYAGFDDVTIFSSTEDVLPPLVTAFELTSSNTVRATYNEPMDVASVEDPGNYSIAATISTITYTEPAVGFPYVDITFADDFTDGQLYTLDAALVTDVAGNFLASAPVEFIYNNSTPQLVISEIMYNDPGSDNLEFIEIYNAGTAAALGGLEISGEFSFTFPEQALDAGATVLLALDEAAAESFFGEDFIDWGIDNLGNGGGDILITNFSGALIDSVSYSDDPPWPVEADGDGPSLELISPSLDNSEATNWRATSTQFGDTEVFATPGTVADDLTPLIAFTDGALAVEEGSGALEIGLSLSIPNGMASQATISVKSSSTAAEGEDYTIGSTTIDFTGIAADTQFVQLDIPDNSTLGGKYLILEVSSITNGETGTNNELTLLIKDNDLSAPASPIVPETILEWLGSYEVGGDDAVAEIVAHDPGSQRLFAANSEENRLEIVDFSDPASLGPVNSIDLSVFNVGEINSVAAYNGIVAVAMAADATSANGSVLFFDTDGFLLSSVEVGVLPDMLIFTPDGSKLLTANEGEPNDEYTEDPEGSVSIIDLTAGVENLTNADVTNVSFTAFNAQEADLKAAGVRIFGPGATVAQDLESEYIAISDDGATAYVTCQENNALVIVDIEAAQALDVLPLGYKDWSAEGVVLDASNRSPDIFLANWPILGMYQPDATLYFSVGGQGYLITTNEGDARDYDGFSEEARVGDSEVVLDPTAYPDAEELKKDVLLGRLNITTATGDTDGDGDLDQIYAYGARSFSIWNASTGELVYDSGSELELIIANDPVFGDLFNANEDENGAKARSDDKGPEPEAVAVGSVNGRLYAFIGLERIGGIMVYDITDPAAPQYLQYINTRDTDEVGGDLSPEDVIFITAEDSPNGLPLVVASHEVSGTLAIFEVKTTPTITFAEANSFVEEGSGALQVELAVETPGALSGKVVVNVVSASTAVDDEDYTIASTTVDFAAGDDTPQFLSLDILDNSVEGGRYLILEIDAAASNVKVGEDGYHIVLVQDNDATAPMAQADPYLQMNYLGNVALTEGSTAEIVAYDPASTRLFVTNSEENRLEIIDYSDPSALTRLDSIDLSPYGGGVNSVAVNSGIVAVAVEAEATDGNGSVVFFDTDGTFMNSVEVGVLPDMLLFSPDGSKVLTANEGEPSDDYMVDPEGSVSIIDVSGGVMNATVMTVGFQAFNDQQAALEAQGLRIFGPGATLAQDMEPEYIAISDDGATAYVGCQENNALAILDIATATVTAILPLGTKDWTEEGITFDASNRTDGIFFANWPVKGMYQPDAIDHFTVGGSSYLITANEGDARDYDEFSEEFRIGDDEIVLDETAFPDAEYLKDNALLGRLRITNQTGDTDGDGDIDEIHAYGARSFTIWDAATGAVVYDSGDDLEQITAADPVYGVLFNSDDEENDFKARSDDKGPEPEAVVTAEIDGRHFAFVALERTGGIMAYEVTDPTAPEFIQYINTRTVDEVGGDLSPEGLVFIPAAESPNGKPLLAVSYEVSGTLGLFELELSCPITTLDEFVEACEGEEVVLSVGDAYANVNWSTGEESPSIVVTEGGEYIVEAVTAGGCVAMDTVGVNFNPLPEFSFPADTTICAEDITVFDPGAGNSIIVEGETLDFYSVENFEPGDYMIDAIVVNEFNCEVPLTLNFTVDICVGTEAIARAESVELFPNPTSGRATVRLRNLRDTDYRLDVVSSTGQLVQHQRVVPAQSEYQAEISLTAMPAGIYLVRLYSSDGVRVKRLVVE